jgi:hypothetical protein
MWPSFHGGSVSRAGTAFVGFSMQTGRSYPPRLVSFQFDVQQGLALEFGNFYMRVIYDGGFVTDVLASITNITNANPAVLTASTSALGAASATVNTGGITASYAPADLVTLAGGVFSQAAQVQVGTTELINLASAVLGRGYVPADTIDLAGGTQTTTAVVTVATTAVSSGSGLTGGATAAGDYVLQGTTGTGTRFQVLASYNLGFTLLGIINAGSYTVNPTTLSNEPLTKISGPGTISSAHMAITMGVGTTTITNAGVFTANPPGGTFTQASTSGSGTGATFKNAIMGPTGVTVVVPGSYTNFPSNPVAQASTNGTGRGATFDVTTEAVGGVPFNVGDWIAVSGVGGMTQVNGQTYVIAAVNGNAYTLNDVYGNNINSTAFGAYTSGGMASRIYTLVTPYAEEDLIWLKWTQSADVMSLCCVNQQTLTEYAPQDLTRFADDDWSFSPVIPSATVMPPASASASASSSGDVYYQYVVTAVNPLDGSESIASPIAALTDSVDVATTAGTITVTWGASPTPNVNVYNIYKAEPGYETAPPVGSLFGFAGQAYGAQFLDSNIVADFTQVPPTDQNPFARGQIIGATVTNSTGTVSAVSFTINTSTGSGAELEGVIVNSVLVAILVLEEGSGYGPDDTVSISVTGGGSATATLSIGPQSGTYPGVPTYYQQRRAYGYSLNNPDTYWMSQPGSFTNFNFRIPTIDSDAITGSPWEIEVNGIQWMLLMPAGLLVMTGLSAWLLVGAGSFATNVQPISPSSEDANPQAFTGCSPTVPPIKINYDVLYVTWEGSFYYDLPYQLYALSEPIDITQNSRHLFTGYNIVQHAWCEQPFKLLWAVRSDGILLSLTYLKAEQVAGWAHHDTFGQWVTVCSIKEPPNDALYLGTQRSFGTNVAYTIERMDNRQWAMTEDCWCVDCGLTLPLPTPAASLTASSATGLGSITGATNIAAGASYSGATTWAVVDNNGTGPGTGAVPTVTLNGSGGVASVTFSGGNQGSGYINPALVPNDPTNAGSGFSCELTLNNSATFTASAAVFSSGNVGNFIRMGGGIIEVAAYTSTTVVTGNILSPIVEVMQGASGVVPLVAASGDWSLAAPVSTVYVPQFIGATVTGLADGNVIASQVIGSNGEVTLPNPATLVTIGTNFVAQLQTVYLDGGEPTMQGQRKKIAGVTCRLEQTLGATVTSNQQDASTLSPQPLGAVWNTLEPVPTPPLPSSATPPPYNALAPSLYTGDSQRIPVQGGFGKPGQVALQQTAPLPMTVLALIPSFLGGDKPEQGVSPKQNQRGR